MRTFGIEFCIALASVCLITMVGCSGNGFQMVSVSGTVSLDGNPVEGAEVVFAPMESDGVVEVGPVSVGKTDKDGRYSLKTTKGDRGAVATRHRVSIQFPVPTDAEIAARVDNAVAENPGMSESEFLAIEKKVRNQSAGQTKLPESYNIKSVIEFDANATTDSADFALKSDGSWSP